MTITATVRDAQNASGEDFPWGRIRWLCNRTIDPDAEMTFGVVSINPGEKNPLHSHPNCEELIYLLGGQCEHRLGEASHPLRTGMMLRIPRGVRHCARNTGSEPVTMVIAYSSPVRETVFHEE